MRSFRTWDDERHPSPLKQLAVSLLKRKWRDSFFDHEGKRGDVQWVLYCVWFDLCCLKQAVCRYFLGRSFFRRDKCVRKGCDLSRGRGSVFCREHESCAPSATCNDLPVVFSADSEDVLDDAYESTWQDLAEDSRLDPVTVAYCKRLRDLERKVRS
jgi:hypothetical protein